MLKTVKGEVREEITEKKSKFLAHLFYIETAKEAEEKIDYINLTYSVYVGN